MKKIKTIKFIFFIIVVLFIGIICKKWLVHMNEQDYYQRLASCIDTQFSFDIVYKSEPGFGNDEFTICRFSLKQPKALDDFNFLDSFFHEKIEYIKDVIDMYDFCDPLFEQEFLNLENSKGTTYLYRKIINDLDYDIYIYNQELNIGYYIREIF